MASSVTQLFSPNELPIAAPPPPAPVQQAPVIKRAVCVPSSLILPHLSVTEVPWLSAAEYKKVRSLNLNKHLTLVDRQQCETDESLLQLIPYVAMHNTELNAYYVYKRGTAGDERRLHNLMSIGLGGHVDRLPDPQMAESMEELIASEIGRELQEEVGYNPPAECYFNLAVAQTLQASQKYKTARCVGVFHYNGDEVNRVHLALGFVLEVPNFIVRNEEGFVENGTWVKKEDFQTFLEETGGRFEPWSAYLAQML